ncbi:hypothetical protein ABEB36_001174 [Hypothenemus hampei]|uniref:Uncharacterized protein n=1 Tax=Hypothenemus hampei TaxID=57062 RepID=A0ABD1FDQ9_HYPHA
MVYIKNDGTLSQEPPIHLKLLRFIVGTFTFIIFFFKSLVGLDTRSSGNSGSNFFRGGGGGDGHRPFRPGGGGGGGGGGPNIRTMRDINPPTVRGVSGCPGGSCGM